MSALCWACITIVLGLRHNCVGPTTQLYWDYFKIVLGLCSSVLDLRSPLKKNIFPTYLQPTYLLYIASIQDLADPSAHPTIRGERYSHKKTSYVDSTRHSYMTSCHRRSPRQLPKIALKLWRALSSLMCRAPGLRCRDQ